MARRALQVVGQRPVDLDPERVLHPTGEEGGDAAELGVAEGVLAGAGVGYMATVGVAQPFARHDDAVAHASTIAWTRARKSASS